MRKIEAKMNQAIRQGEDLTMGNTKVRQYGNGCEVKLHNHTIADINFDTGKAVITDCGYQTATTKSRLNAILSGLGTDAHLYQCNFEWFLSMGASEVDVESGSMHVIQYA